MVHSRHRKKEYCVMKKRFWIFLGLISATLVFSSSPSYGASFLLAQASPIDAGRRSQDQQPHVQGCQVIDIRCVCEHPKKDYVIKDRKVGKVNPGEPGECRVKADIDEFLKEDALGLCLPEGEVKDASKGQQSKCTTTWICKKPCTIKKNPSLF